MAAVIDLHTGEHLDRLPTHPRPSLRLVEGGRSGLHPRRVRPSATARTYLVRRVLAATVAVVVVLCAVQVLAFAGRAVLGALDGVPTPSGRIHVVRSGDTAWSIAGRYAPGMDRRDAVDDLVALNGSRVLRPGLELQIPASFG